MAIEIGRVTGHEFALNRDSEHPVRMLQVELTAEDDVQNIEWMGSGGADFAPPVGAYVLVLSITSANRYAVASDSGVTPSAEDGDYPIFAVEDGEIKAKLTLYTDGNLKLDPVDDGTIQLAGDARDASGVGHTITIDATTDPAFFTWLGTVGGVIGTPPPTSITGKISSGASKVKLP